MRNIFICQLTGTELRRPSDTRMGYPSDRTSPYSFRRTAALSGPAVVCPASIISPLFKIGTCVSSSIVGFAALCPSCFTVTLFHQLGRLCIASSRCCLSPHRLSQGQAPYRSGSTKDADETKPTTPARRGVLLLRFPFRVATELTK